MLQLFLNPYTMVAGAALVSSPIIIHLINRIRYRRVRWAAMEFLLKSQKRNRRRLIIEQLILLALRILLVLLVAFLVARWVYGSDKGGQSTLHVILMDDTLSMTDRWKQADGKVLTSWQRASEQVEGLLKKAAKVNSVQEVKVYLLSDLETPVYDGRVSDQTEASVRQALAARGPSYR